MELITIQDISRSDETEKALSYCKHLEEGNILYFPKTPFDLSQEDLNFLLNQQQSDAGYHKNIAYRPAQDRITGIARGPAQETNKLLTIMRDYSKRVTRFLEVLLPPYADSWQLDYASFRPQEEKGRNLRLRARNDLIHVDSFPSRPTHGNRILRVFTNVNPSQPRRWTTTDAFDILVKQFAGTEVPMPKSLDQSLWRRMSYALAKAAHSVGLPVVPRSPYDDFMLRFHHFLKENNDFQTNCPKQTWEFTPYSTWIVFTDMVCHAVLSGQYALEQTYIVSRDSLLLPQKAPVNILENLCSASLTHR